MRHRERGNIATSPITVGRNFVDITYPYDDETWYETSSSKKSWYGDSHYDFESCDDELHPGPPYQSGGPFCKVALESDDLEVKSPVEMITADKRYRYLGGFLPSYSPRAYLDYSKLSEVSNIQNWGDVSSYGATGWNRFRPGKAKVDMGVFLGELREAPRMLMSSAKTFHNIWKGMGGWKKAFGPKSVANEWLNTQFGWRPFLSDLFAFHKTCKSIELQFNQLKRDNGQWVKRGGTMQRSQETEVVENTNVPGLWPPLNPYFYVSSTLDGNRTITRRNTSKIWFEGRFRYWIPNLGTNPWGWRSLVQLYGLNPFSPSLIWNLTPWSWLIDWWCNAGDVISNVTAMHFDNLCAKYAYCMGTKEQEVQFFGSNKFATGTLTNRWYAKLISKQRVEASPFGFGLDPGNFTGWQWSILAALGYSRLHGWKRPHS